MFSGKLTSEATIADVLDKGSGAVILLDGEFHKCYHIVYLFHILLFLSVQFFLSLKVASQAVNLLLLSQPVSAGIEIMD